jgi:hypothetical protein
MQQILAAFNIIAWLALSAPNFFSELEFYRQLTCDPEGFLPMRRYAVMSGRKTAGGQFCSKPAPDTLA